MRAGCCRELFEALAPELSAVVARRDQLAETQAYASDKFTPLHRRYVRSNLVQERLHELSSANQLVVDCLAACRVDLVLRHGGILLYASPDRASAAFRRAIS